MLEREGIVGDHAKKSYNTQRENQNLQIKEEQTTQWPTQGQRDKEPSTKHYTEN